MRVEVESLASTIGIDQITQRIIDVMSGSEFATDLDDIRIKYGYTPSEMPQPDTEGTDIFTYETMGSEGIQWPYLMVVWDSDEVITWARANQATERATFRIIFGVQNGENNERVLLATVKAYIDAAKRTLVRAVRTGAISDCRHVTASRGGVFATESNSLVQYGTLQIVVDYYTTTETT